MFKKSDKRIYMDYASTTPTDAKVLKAMLPYFTDDFGNPSSIHKEGMCAKEALDNARKNIANILNTKAEDIVFTSGGTESNNLAIFGILNTFLNQGTDPRDLHMITSTIEHPSVLEVFRELEKLGVSVTYINTEKEGIVNTKEIKKAIQENTILVSIMYINNEIGTIQPIGEIAKIIKRKRKERIESFSSNLQPLYFHTDASQAPLYFSLDTVKLGVDMMTLCGQKIYGPKGIGCLYKDKDIQLNSIIKGGSQENGLRAGTENIPLIVGFSKALEIANKDREKESQRVAKLRDYFINKLNKEIPQIELNGSKEQRSPNNINIYIPNIDGEFFTIILDSKGVSCATRSACKESDELQGSYVIDALGYESSRSKSSLRFTLGKTTNKKDIDFVISILVLQTAINMPH